MVANSPEVNLQSLPHEGRAFGRGFANGVRLLADALRRGDLAEAQKIIAIAEQRPADRGARA